MVTKKVEKKEDKITKKDLKLVENIVGELFELVGVEAQSEVVEDKENDAILINLSSEKESGLLIGARGDTLISIQTIVAMIFQNKTDRWVRILLNIADWREKEKDRLERMAFQVAERARSTKETQTLYNLSPSQRRTVHITLSKEKDLETESKGEGRNRYLTVSLKE
jgi:spoIIIJ-associated protein